MGLACVTRNNVVLDISISSSERVGNQRWEAKVSDWRRQRTRAHFAVVFCRRDESGRRSGAPRKAFGCRVSVIVFHAMENMLPQCGKNPGVADLLPLLLASGEELTRLYARADAVRREYCGEAVPVRAILEFSNYCANECLYCGLRAENAVPTRYRMARMIPGRYQIAAPAWRDGRCRRAKRRISIIAP